MEGEITPNHAVNEAPEGVSVSPGSVPSDSLPLFSRQVPYQLG